MFTIKFLTHEWRF